MKILKLKLIQKQAKLEQIWYLHIFIHPGGTYLANCYLVAQLIFSQTNEDDL